MAGMLPGVEFARRRRFHQSSLSYGSESSPITISGSTRRSSSNSSMHRNSVGQLGALCDEDRLGAAAREAKKRLDKKLQAQWRSPEFKRSQSGQTEIPKLKRSGLKRLHWLRLSWKSGDEEECAVCLEQFKVTGWGVTLMQLPCGHKFHTNCLVPWLETKANAHCPCCRMEILSS